VETREAILLVEDTPDLLETLHRLLEASDYSVLPARDGLEALEKMQASGGRIDILITDLVMPEMDGVDVAAWAVRLCPKVKVLFISGVGEQIGKAVPEGSIVLQKPFLGKELLKVVSSLTGRNGRLA
jgi:two-component system cell cycle sensor histidine kinase/response regulator CckA